MILELRVERDLDRLHQADALPSTALSQSLAESHHTFEKKTRNHKKNPQGIFINQWYSKIRSVM